VHDDSGRLIAYGYLLERDKKLRHFNLYYAGRVFNDLSLVSYTPTHISYAGILDISLDYNGGHSIFEWNKAIASGDLFLESFHGFHRVPYCTANLDGQEYRCHVLDERLSADLSLIKPWKGETVLFLDGGNEVSILAFAYDAYVDGVVSWGRENQKISSVTRTNWDITIALDNGTVHAACLPLASYYIYPALDPQPTNTVVRCNLMLDLSGESVSISSVYGMIEWIGQKQGD
jgi:hypothetical protein